MDNAESNEVLLWQNQDLCFMRNLRLLELHIYRAISRRRMRLQCWSVEKSREHSLPAKKGQVPGKVKLPYRGDWKLITCISSFRNKQNFFKRMTARNTMSLVCHLLVRWSGTLSQWVFFLWTFCFFLLARIGLVKKKRDEKQKKKHLALSLLCCSS